MKKQIDHFLLGLLWLLAVTLGASFWFSTNFGFNIFSAAHWEYLGQLQASRIPINAWFYISMVLVVFVMIFGLYLLIKPRFRRIHTSAPETAIFTTSDASEINLLPGEPVVTEKPVVIQAVRPPKLNLPRINNYPGTAPAATSVEMDRNGLSASAAPSIDKASDGLLNEIKDVLKSVGYVVKDPSRIDDLRHILMAIGTDESLWIGSVGTAPSLLANAVEKLQLIFTDTLQDIQINIHPFILNPQAEDVVPTIDIEKFDSISALRDFMDNNKNREPINSTEKADFDAYSEYIDVVRNHFNNA